MSDNRINTIGWFIAGLSLGAVVAVLYAPKSGRETRQDIANGVDDGRKYLASLGRSAGEQVSGWVASGKKLVTDKKHQVSKGIDAGLEAMRDAAAETRS
jgi:gas vesicle protein